MRSVLLNVKSILCLQSRGSDRAASTLARGASAASVSSLVRLLATSNTDALYHLLASLQRRLPGSDDQDEGAQAKTLGQAVFVVFCAL